MGINEFVSGITGFINWALDKLVFWKNFTTFSMILIALVGIGIYIAYQYVKQLSKSNSSIRRSRRY